MIDVTYFHF